MQVKDVSGTLGYGMPYEIGICNLQQTTLVVQGLIERRNIVCW